ncbi:hypothetical protein MFIFM68171_03993 [Madurella fahalii]|uniref:Uncharacterized protein n=1 Tax=Madurella fahalii TaxID=1157608 RepID=A0ABQ0G7Q1_9PEZI
MSNATDDSQHSEVQPGAKEDGSFNLSWDELAAAFSRIGTMRRNLLLDAMAFREIMDLGRADEGGNTPILWIDLA